MDLAEDKRCASADGRIGNQIDAVTIFAGGTS